MPDDFTRQWELLQGEKSEFMMQCSTVVKILSLQVDTFGYNAT